MEDIGDYLYLIIVVIAGLSSLFKNKSKKKEFAPAPEVEEEYEYKEIPEEVFVPTPVTIPEVVYERPVSQMQAKSQETLVSYETATDFTKLKARKDISKLSTPVSKTVVEQTTETENAYSLNTVEEARAAFIASEIFNRKY